MSNDDYSHLGQAQQAPRQKQQRSSKQQGQQAPRQGGAVNKDTRELKNTLSKIIFWAVVVMCGIYIADKWSIDSWIAVGIHALEAVWFSDELDHTYTWKVGSIGVIQTLIYCVFGAAAGVIVACNYFWKKSGN